MVKAMKTKVGNPLRKLVLIKLADNANDNGECWPSYQHIADQCEISPRSVMRHVVALREAGLLSKEHRPGPKGNTSNMYTLTLEGVTESHKGGDRESLGGSDRESPRTSHSLEPVKEPNAPSAQKQAKVTFDGATFIVHSEQLEQTWLTTYGESKVAHEIAKAQAWVIATGAKKKDWARFLNNWLANSKATAIDETGCPVDKIIDLYHEQCPAFPVVTVRDDKALRSMIVDRWRESAEHQSGKFWQKIFSRANRRSEVFYRGQKCAPRLEAIVSRAVFRELEEVSV